MAEQLLGPAFEIHGGGLDLVFPHHENELAQSSALGHEFARIWMHNGMLRFTGEKMSKSVGNVATIKEALDEWGRETALVFFLTAHWRSPIDYSDETMGSAAARAEGFREVFRNPSHAAPPAAWQAFEEALDDDFNTAGALALLHEWRDHDCCDAAASTSSGSPRWRMPGSAPPDHDLAQGRLKARAAGDYAEADRLRAEIEAAGWDVRDDPGGYRLVPRS